MISDQEEFALLAFVAHLEVIYEALYEREGNTEDWWGREKNEKNSVASPWPELCKDLKAKTNLHLILINHF